jgi:Skp family chaperone for outer membrane proteins
MKKILLAAAIPTLALLWAMNRAEKPTTVAFIDLTRVFPALDRSKAAQARLEEINKAQAAKIDKLLAEIQSLQAELETYKADSPSFNEAKKKVTDAITRKKALEEFSRRKLAIESANLMLQTYKDICKSAGELCSQRGIDALLFDDASAPFDPADPRGPQAQILGRRCVWLNKSLDITDDVIKAMNAAPATPAPAAAAGPAK